MTGVLGIIQNSKLRTLFSIGPKYREPKSFDWKKVREYINLRKSCVQITEVTNIGRMKLYQKIG